MNLFAKLKARAEQNNPIRIGVIGAGKFASMYLAQVPKTPGIHVVGIADLAPDRAAANLARVGWPQAQYQATSLEQARALGTTFLTDDWQALVQHGAIDLILEATGSPIAAVDHCLAAFAQGKHVVNVTVEADALCGPMLARRAQASGCLYSLAYGDQPALVCDLVDWARAAGFDVVAAGRGHKWLPHFAQSTPETVWGHYGLTPEQAARGGLNPKMFNSFLDGSKPAIESTAICNATGLVAPPDGLTYPPASVDDIAYVCRPQSEGGVLHQKGQVEVVSSLERDGRVIPYDIRFGVFVVFEGETDYIRDCFSEYMVRTDPSGRYACLYKRWHLIGLEVGISVASVALRGETTGSPVCLNADVVACAKRDLAPGDILDGEGGYTVVGQLFQASQSKALDALPLGLAHDLPVTRPVKAGQPLRWADVTANTTLAAYQLRQDMMKHFPLGPSVP